MTSRWPFAALLPAIAAAACSAREPARPVEPARAIPFAAAPRTVAARWLVPAGSFVERTPEGLDRVVAGGRRFELRGLDPIEVAPEALDLTLGAVAPPWAGEGPQRYVFCRERTLYGASTFLGELHEIATLPADPRGSFDWTSGVALALAGSSAVVASVGGGLAPLPISMASFGVAADARRAVAVDVLGRPALTLDAGATFRDVSAELGLVPRLAVRGDTLVATRADGGERFVVPSGAIVAAPIERGPDRSRRPADDVDAWPPSLGTGALDAALASGVLLPDGGAAIVAHGFVGRLDLTTLRVTSTLPIPSAAAAECAPIRQGRAVLVVCADKERALVVDVTTTPRIERTFEQPASRNRDRFTGGDDEGLGFLGPCDRGALPSGGDSASPDRSAVFCARGADEAWVEHRLAAADAADVIAWIPRPNGGAVALVARPGTSLPDAERVSVDGDLRVVRVARDEPPLSVPASAWHASMLLNRAFRVRVDDVIEGWLPWANGRAGVGAITIDAAGRARAEPSPSRARPLRADGAFALASTDDDQLYETTDRGRTWSPVATPLGPVALSAGVPCSAVGCRVGAWVRLGWSGRAMASIPVEAPPPRRAQPGRALPSPPLVALRCRAAGPAVAVRSTSAVGFGASPTSMTRGSGLLRLGAQGAVQIPWNGVPSGLPGLVELAWIPPLDPAAPIRRRAFSVATPGVVVPKEPPYDVGLGHVLDRRGGLELIPLGRAEGCLDSVLDHAGVTRPIGGCADALSVGVELDDRAILAAPSQGAILVSSAAPLTRPGASRELWRNPVAPTRGFSFGVGERAGAAVLAVVGVLGEALLAPIDRDRGTLGAPSPLRSLSALALGSDASCRGPGAAGEARIVVPFETAIGLDRRELPGVFESGAGGVAVIRWSRERACLDAVEIGVRDERYEVDRGGYDPAGTVRKLIARFDVASARKGGSAGLVLITPGSEIRQPLVCAGIAATPP